MYDFFFMPTFVSSSVFLANTFLLKEKKTWKWYLGFYIILLTISYFYPSPRLHAEEMPYATEEVREMEVNNYLEIYKRNHPDEEIVNFDNFYHEYLLPRKIVKLTAKQKAEYLNKAFAYRCEGRRYLDVADDISLLIPKIKLREKAHTAIESAIVSLVVPGPMAKVIATLTIVLKSYLCNVYDAWEDMKYYLDLSKEMYAKADYYQLILDNDAKVK